MFPTVDSKLFFREIADYWSREIQPTASKLELQTLLERAWWLGEIRGNPAKSRLRFLQIMFKQMHGRDDLGITFVRSEGTTLVDPVELPDGSVEVDARVRIPVPTEDMNRWKEDDCEIAFRAMAQTSSTNSYPEMTLAFDLIEVSYEEFNVWRQKRGYAKPKFWRPRANLDKPPRGRPAEYNWNGVKDKLGAYVLQNGPMRTQEELLQKCADFASELHPQNKEPDDKTIREAIETHALDLAAGFSPGK